MYLKHFGLREPPFSLTPDTSFYFNHTGNQQALNVVLVALRTGEGFIKITGEVGTGKTLLCRKLLDGLPGNVVTAYLPNPLLTPLELHRAFADELGIPGPRDATLHRLQKRITARLLALNGAGRRVVLCIDEVQAMPAKSLEALRLLSNLETEKRKLFHVILFAQPELDARLAHPALRQLRQRITFAYRLAPLDREGLRGYVAHRLLVAGCHGGALFRPRALAVVYRASRGIPRLVNILCHKAMLAAYGRGDRVIDKSQVKAAVRDTADAGPAAGSELFRFFTRA